MAQTSLLTTRLIKAVKRAYFGRSLHKSNRCIKRVALLLENSVREKHAEAVYWLATMHWEGWGVTEDQQRAIQLFHLAAEYGSRAAQYNLGVAYDTGLGVKKNQARAFGFFVAAAKHGEAEAMHSVGSMCYWGHGVIQDFTKARYWYRKSAKLGFSDGMCDLARCYQRGVGGLRSQRWAIYWFMKAIEAGSMRAQTWLGLEYTLKPIQDWPKARYWLEKAAEQDQVQAMYFLGCWEESGWTGKENPADALFWYNHAAKLGHQGAALNAAELHGEIF